MANKCMKKFSMSLIKMKMKMTLTFHFTPVRMLSSISQTTTNDDKDAWKKEHLHIVDGNVN
jgi:hypothetical protein